MEGIPGTQDYRHPAKQVELAGRFVLPDHAYTHGQYRYQIDRIKGGFHNCLHTKSSFLIQRI